MLRVTATFTRRGTQQGEGEGGDAEGLEKMMAAMGGAEGMGGMGGMPGMGGMGADRSPEDHKKEVEALKAVSSPYSPSQAIDTAYCGPTRLLRDVLVLCLERDVEGVMNDQRAMANDSRVRPTLPHEPTKPRNPPLSPWCLGLVGKNSAHRFLCTFMFLARTCLVFSNLFPFLECA